MTDTLPTATDLRRVLEALDSAIIAEPKQRLGVLALGVIRDYTRYDGRLHLPLISAVAGALRTLAGNSYASLTGQAALDLVRQALDALAVEQQVPKGTNRGDGTAPAREGDIL